MELLLCCSASGNRGHFCCEESAIKNVIVKQNCVLESLTRIFHCVENLKNYNYEIKCLLKSDTILRMLVEIHVGYLQLKEYIYCISP